MKENKHTNCSTNRWSIPHKHTRKFRPPIWPGVYMWLLVGVLFILSKLFLS